MEMEINCFNDHCGRCSVNMFVLHSGSETCNVTYENTLGQLQKRTTIFFFTNYMGNKRDKEKICG